MNISVVNVRVPKKAGTVKSLRLKIKIRRNEIVKEGLIIGSKILNSILRNEIIINPDSSIPLLTREIALPVMSIAIG